MESDYIIVYSHTMPSLIFARTCKPVIDFNPPISVVPTKDLISSFNHDCATACTLVKVREDLLLLTINL